MNGQILTFGELLLRFSPDVDADWLRANNCPVFVGGAEANVATALGLWGKDVAYVSVLPDNLLTTQLLQYLNSKNIATDHVLRQGERMGIFYLPIGSDMKNNATIYDRKYSSFYALQVGEYDWDKAFEGVSWFHLSTLTPALNGTLARVCVEALQKAKEKNIVTSIDLNFRPQLWKYGTTPKDVVPGLVQYCDIVMGNIWAFEKMLGIELPNPLLGSGKDEPYLSQAADSSEKIISLFPQVKYVANTFRFDQGQSGIRYFATLYHQKELFVSKVFHSEQIIDKVGSGDCFMAGLIDGIYDEKMPQQVIDFATAAAFNKLFIKGDTTTSAKSAILDFAKDL